MNTSPQKFRYKVKFTNARGDTVFGRIRSYGEDVEKQRKRGFAIVDDAVRPVAYLVPEVDVIDVETKVGFYNRKLGKTIGGDEVQQYVENEYDQARKTAASLPDDGQLHAGALFQIGVADGYAFYVVTNVGKRTCKVEWRGFGGDSYQDHHFGLGGAFPIRDVLRYVQHNRAMEKLFREEKRNGR